MRSSAIGFGLIGAGEVSDFHEKGYQAAKNKGRIVAVCDLDENKAREKAAPHKARVYTDYHQLLANTDVEAVDIMLPHFLHFPVAAAALEHGKHVIVEKPITVSWQEGEQLCELARRQGVRFTVAENTRYVTAYQEVEKLIREGVLGEPCLIRTFIYGSEMIRLHDPNSWVRPGQRIRRRRNHRHGGSFPVSAQMAVW